MKCYCCSDIEFADCCQPFTGGISKPLTAEKLMRSRYSAYAIAAVEYLVKTTHPSMRKFHDAEAIESWAKSSIWEKLEIVAKSGGEVKDKAGVVEFKAYFADAESGAQVHHEISSFRKELGRWFFVDGKIKS